MEVPSISPDVDAVRQQPLLAHIPAMCVFFTWETSWPNGETSWPWLGHVDYDYHDWSI